MMPRRFLLKAALLILALTGLLLWVPLRAEMGMGASLTLLAHLGVGLLVLLPCGVFLLRTWKTAGAWRRLAALSGGICGLTGAGMIAQAAGGSVVSLSGFSGVVHIGSGLAVVLFLRVRGVCNRGGGVERPRSSAAPALLALALFLLPLLAWVSADRLLYSSESYARSLASVTSEEAQNPHFPASLKTVAGGSDEETVRFWNAQKASTCAAQGCHPKAHREWNTSAHARASVGPLYRASLADFRNARGRRAALWCAGCHSPAGAFRGEDEGADGVDCLSCHAMRSDAGEERRGNGAALYEVKEPYPFSEAAGGAEHWLHRFLMNVRSRPHRQAFLRSEFHAAPESCAPCHRQSHNVAQNRFQAVKTTDTYGDWRKSGLSGRGIADFFPRPASGKTCAGCHFPATPESSVSHQLPARSPDFLQDRVRLDLFALRTPAPAAPRGEFWTVPLDAPSAPLPPPSAVPSTLELLVTNDTIGHAFPGGYEDLRRAWIELTLTDEAGRVLASSGRIARASDPLPPNTHVYGKLALDREGKPLFRHHLFRQTALAWRRVLEPGASELVRYRLRIPRGRWKLTAQLNFQEVSPEITRWAEGERAVPKPIRVLAKTELTVSGGRVIEAAGASTAPLWERWTRCGLAALAPADRPDLSRSLYALKRAQSLAPRMPETALALGRCYLREPALLAARSQFEAAQSFTSDSPEARFGLGSVLRRQGQYDAALALLQPLLARFPEDTALCCEIAQCDYYAGRYADAAKMLEAALAADPDDERTHFQLQQCYQRLQRIPDARREEMIRRYLTVTPWSDSLTSDYRRAHPEEANRWLGLPVYGLK